MKFLFTIILSAIVMGCASASTDIRNQFRTAIDEDNLEKAVTLFKQFSYLSHEELDYVIESKQPEFVVRFIKEADIVNWSALAKVYEKGSPETIKKVLDEVGFTDYDLVELAERPIVACSPKNFLDLLSRITKPEFQERTVRNGIYEIFFSCRDHIDPLLDALESSTFSKSVKDAAIQEVFTDGAYHRQNKLVERFLDYPTITPKVYAEGLLATWTSNPEQNTLFPILLKEADKDDLLATMGGFQYAFLNKDFKAAIEEALPKAERGGTRTANVERAKIAEETFAELGHPGVPPTVAGVISSYLTGQEPEKAKKGGGKTEAPTQEEQAVIGKVEVGGEEGEVGEEEVEETVD